jgi:signal peptidase
MTLKRWSMRLFEAAVVIVVLSLVIGSLFGQPILLSYVETGSMSPTLESGDGFVAVPIQLDDSIQAGDVTVFEAKKIQGGGLTTHRVVGETDRGFITKGDANPFTDQSNEELPVKRAQVVAKALQMGGHVVVIPHLGTVVEATQSVLSAVQRRLATLLGMSALLGPQGLAYLIFAGTVLWYVVGEWRAENGRERDRVTSRMAGVDTRLVMGAFAVLLILGATAAMVVPAGTQQYGVVSAESASDRPDVISMGESKSQRYAVENGGFLPMVTYLGPASEGVEIQPQEVYVEGKSVANATVTFHVPPETGYYRRFVAEHRYLAVLPTSTIRTLHEIHPWLPVVVIDAMIAGTFLVLTLPFLGSGPLRDRSRNGTRRGLLTRLIR